MKNLFLTLFLLLPSWAAAGEDPGQEIPRICMDAEILSETPGNNPARVLELYGQCLDEQLPGQIRASVFYNMGVIHQDMRNWPRALQDYEAATRLDPGDFQSYSNMAWILATSPDPAVLDGAQALRLSRKACAISANLGTQDTHAAALARTGRFDKAAALQAELIRRARQLEGFPKELLNEMENRLKLYASGSPYTESAPTTAY